MVALLSCSRFPRAELTADQQAVVVTYRQFFRRPMVWAFFLCVFAYVGSKQGTANWISELLSKYHGDDPHTTGATAGPWFWGLLTVGCFIRHVAVKIFRQPICSDRHLPGSAVVFDRRAVGLVSVSVIAFPAIGLFASVMWPILVSLDSTRSPSTTVRSPEF